MLNPSSLLDSLSARAKSGDESASELSAVLEQYLEDLESGRPVDRTALLAAHPHLDALEENLNKLEALHAAATGLAHPNLPLPGFVAPLPVDDDESSQRYQIGDFRILREIGRGGMGVVYEAEQHSLGRKVALKILPLAGMLDKRQLTRFQNEARAAATLKHPNIVSIYSVGCDRGVHHYAMELIEGASLAEVISALRHGTEVRGQKSEVGPSTTGVQPVRAGKGHQAEVSSHPEAAVHSSGQQPTANSQQPSQSEIRNQESEIETKAIAALTTEYATDPKRYFRRVAELGIQAASALDHAQEQGIIHRDIKPGNLLLDEEGKLLIADFGLARLETDASVTASGNIVGTLRYMSPEQARGNRTIDHRTDIYSLGATLYELLTHQSLFPVTNRQVLLRQVAYHEPRKPRQINIRIPQDLETIVLKAIEKNPTDRYESSAALAADLQRFLAHQPIKARPATYVHRLAKWSHRHVAAVWSTITALVVILIMSLGSTLLVAQWYREANTQRLAAEREYQRAAAAKQQSENDRQAALDQRDKAQANLYIADMRLAIRDWQDGNIGRLRTSLKRHIPTGNTRDRRDWEWYWLDALCKQAIWTSDSSIGGAQWLAWSPDATLIAAAQWESGVRLLDAKTGASIKLLGTSSGRVDWNPDSTRLLSASETGIEIWNCPTGNKEMSLKVSSFPTCVAWSSDGTHFAFVISSEADTLKIADSSTGAIVNHKLDMEGRNAVYALRWSSDDSLLACACADEVLRIFDVKAGQVVRSTRTADETFAVAWTPDDTRLVTGGMEGIVQAWDAATLDCLFTAPMGSAVEQLSWNRDGTRVAAAVRRGEARLLDGQTGELLHRYKGHYGWVHSVSWSPDGEHIATCGDERIMVWDAARHQHGVIQLEPLAEPGWLQLAWSSDDRFLGVALSDALHMIEVKSGAVNRLFPASTRWGLPWSWAGHDSKRIAVVQSGNKHVQIFRTGDGAKLDGFDSDGKVVGVDASPDGAHLVVVAESGKLQVWRLRPKSLVFEAAFRSNSLNSTAWSPDGAMLALSHAWDGLIEIFDTRTWTLVQRLTGHDKWLRSLKWSPDGALLCGGGWDQKLWVWNVRTGRIIHSLRGHSGFISCVAWSPSGRRLCSVGPMDTLVRIWQVASGEEVLAIPMPDAAVSAAWSTDGKRLAIADQKGKVTIWNSARGE